MKISCRHLTKNVPQPVLSVSGTTFVIEESYRPHAKKPEVVVAASAMEVA